MTLYYQAVNKMGLMLEKSAQKTFLIDVSVMPGSQFKFYPLEKELTFFKGIILGTVPGTQFHHLAKK